MQKILILADDLSGAADCASAWTHSGASAIVCFDEGQRVLEEEIVCVDCDTRHLAPDEAAARFTRAMRSPLLRAAERLLFKKIDSTLRGNIASELAAMLVERRAGSRRRVIAVVAPAFPAGGRTTVGGRQFVRGVPLEETETWRHDASAGHSAHLPVLINRPGLTTALVTLSKVRSDSSHLCSTMRELAAEADVVVCDAETDGDLQAIVRASLALEIDVIWVGSAGLAYQLPHMLSRASSMYGEPQPTFSAGASLFVVGSMSSTSHHQARVLEDICQVATVRLSADVLLEGPSRSACKALAEQIRGSLAAGNDTLVVLESGEGLPLQLRRSLTIALGSVLGPCAPLVGSFFATGGETARAILEAWGVAALHMLGEVQPSVPFSFGRINDRPLPIVTKAGAFGDQDTLVSCWRFLNALPRTSHRSTARNIL